VFCIADVAGKGVPASLFMTVSKALHKSLALRADSSGDVGMLLREADAELSRDNPEAMFVTIVSGWIDLARGEVRWCSAGHDLPYRLRSGKAPERLTGDSGPPLCVLDGYEYREHTILLEAGDTLVLFTDGVTEAMDGQGRLYGRARLEHALAGDQAPQAVLRRIESDVSDYAAGADLADDMAVLALRWNGRQ
jgi:adenylate cyclase